MKRIGMRVIALALLLALTSVAQANNNGCTNCAPAPVVVHGVGTASCGDCGPTVKNSLHAKVASHPDVRFMFGSSRNFFAPCSNNMCDLLGGPRKHPCALPMYGTGIGQPAENCKGPVTFTTR